MEDSISKQHQLPFQTNSSCLLTNVVCSQHQNSYDHVFLFTYNKKCVFCVCTCVAKYNVKRYNLEGKIMEMLRYFNALFKKQDRTALENLSLMAIFALPISKTENHYVCKYDS